MQINFDLLNDVIFGNISYLLLIISMMMTRMLIFGLLRSDREFQAAFMIISGYMIRWGHFGKRPLLW